MSVIFNALGATLALARPLALFLLLMLVGGLWMAGPAAGDVEKRLLEAGRESAAERAA